MASSTDEDYAKFLDITGVVVNTRRYTDNQLAVLENLRNQLRQYNKKYRSNYLLPKLGITGTHIVNPRNKVYWDINASYKEYTRAKQYNIAQTNITLGTTNNINKDYLFGGNFYYQEYLMGDKRYRETPMGALRIGRFLGSNNMLSIYTNVGILAYPVDHTLSVNMYVGGLEWNYFDNYRTVVAQFYYGRNKARDILANYNSSNYYGIDISAKHKITDKLSVTAEVTHQNSFYDTKQFIDAPKRHDPFYQYTAGIYYRLLPGCTWYALAAYTDNHSNIFTYEYDRLEAVTGINFEL